MVWHSSTRSKSPSRKARTASCGVDTVSTMQPNSFMICRRVSARAASRLTESTKYTAIKSPGTRVAPGKELAGQAFQKASDDLQLTLALPGKPCQGVISLRYHAFREALQVCVPLQPGRSCSHAPCRPPRAPQPQQFYLAGSHGSHRAEPAH